MPYIIYVGTAVLAFKVGQDEVRGFAARLFRKASSFKVERFLSVFKIARISERHFCVGGDWFDPHRSKSIWT